MRAKKARAGALMGEQDGPEGVAAGEPQLQDGPDGVASSCGVWRPPVHGQVSLNSSLDGIDVDEDTRFALTPDVLWVHDPDR